jgi:signal peptidase I
MQIKSQVKLLSFLILFLVVRFFVFIPYKISGASMWPYVQTNSRVIVNVLNHSPNYDDVVIINDSSVRKGSPIALIKRVIALEGDTINIRNGQVYVNGIRSIADDHVSFLNVNLTENLITLVPSGCIYVLGDNRAESTDSRAFGSVPLSAVEGVVLCRLWR